MKNELAPILKEELKNQVVLYLQNDNLIDKLFEDGSLKTTLTNKPSLNNLDLCYDLIIVNTTGLVQNGVNYTFSVVNWQLPYRILEKNRKVYENRNYNAIVGSFKRIDFKVRFDENTGEPIITTENVEYEYNAQVVSIK